MGESSGSTLADVAGSDTAEVSSTGVTLGEPGGLVGDASTSVLFDGSSGAAHASVDLSGTHVLTVEFWMKWKAFASDDALALEFTPNFNEHPGGFLVDPDSPEGGGKFGVGIGEGGSRNNVFFARPSAETWHHYAFVINTEASAETQITPYVDGHVVSYTKSASATGAGSFANSTLFWMSRNASALFGTGSMQDLAIYDSALSSGTIAAHYELGAGGPKAAFGSWPAVVSVGVPVRLDASGSSSPAGSISDYAWDFNGSQTYGTDEGASTTATHTFSSPGTYTVDLRVKDSLGQTATVSHTITVAAELGPYEQAVEKTTGAAHFWPMGEASGTTFADVLAGANAELSSTGVTLGQTGALVGDSATGSAFNGSSGAAHAEVDLSGTYKLTVEFWLKWNAFAENDDLAMELTSNFNEHPGGFLVDPNAAGSEKFGVGLGEGSSRNNAFFNRPTAGAWHYYALVLDTTASGATQITPYVDGRAVSYTKTAQGTEAGAFAKAVLYWMSRDASGLFGAGSMQDLALYEAPLGSSVIAEHYELGEGGPKASFARAPVSASAGVPVHLDASGSSSPAGTITDYAWDFNASKTYSSDEGTSSAATHTFSSPGTYTVDLRVKDSLGQTATVSHTITVGAALGQYERAVEQTPGVQHFWPMSESTGSTFADLYGGSDAELSGSGVTLGQTGGLVEDPATSASFNGSTGAAHAPLDLSSTGEVTVEFWMKWKAYANDDALALEFTTNFNEHPGGFLVDPDSPEAGGTFGIGVGNEGARNNVFFTRPSAETWHYYALVIDTKHPGATVITPYLDGHTVSYTKSAEGTESENLANSTLYWFSRNASTLHGTGSMQDLATYNTTLSESTVLEHYERGEAIYLVKNTTAPSIEGAARDGRTLTADPGTWSGATPITYTYQWQSCNQAGGECQDITGAEGKAYTVGGGDLETTLRVVVSATNPGGSAQAVSAASSEIQQGAPSELAPPSISGTPEVGEPVSSEQGVWQGSEISMRYQWEKCNTTGGECAEIPGATSSNYKPLSEDAGSTLRLRVGASNNLGSLAALSPASAPVATGATPLNTWTPSITGTPQVGQTLIATTGSWLATTVISYSYQWQRCDLGGSGCEPITGATAPSYMLASGDAGHRLRVLVTASETAASAAQASSATLPVAGEGAPVSEELPVISGTALVGETLTVLPGGWQSATALTFTYQWERCNQDGQECSTITGATSSTYTLTESDASGTVRAALSASNTSSLTSAPSQAVTVSQTALDQISGPYITGEAVQGRALEAEPGIWTGKGEITYTYQWQRCSEAGEFCTSISEATRSAYVPSSGDISHKLKVTVTATGPTETSSSSSSATDVVAASTTPPESLLEPSIEGNPVTGETLSAQPGLWVGAEPISYGFQWQRCDAIGDGCMNISGATGETYKLTEADLANTIQVDVTATNSVGSTNATSRRIEAISNPGPPSASESPSIQGTAHVGQQIFATNGIWSGSRPMKYVYAWERCDATGESCIAIEGATKPGYTVTSSDLGHTLLVKITVSNSQGSTSALSSYVVVAASGEANPEEAVESLQATDPSLIAPSTPATFEEESVKPAVTDPGEQLTSIEGLTKSSVSKETTGEFAVDTADGEISIAPIGDSLHATKTPAIANDTAAVFAESSPATDTIIRPNTLGATVLLQLHSTEAPTSFSWEIGLGAHQQLEKLSDGAIAVVEPAASSPIDEPISEETLGSPETATGETSEAEAEATAAEEELESSTGEESPLESLPASPHINTSAITPKAGELHPQETTQRNEKDTTALSAAETESTNKVLMVIELPTVMDAAEHTLEAVFSVSGSVVTMTISPGVGATYPVTAEAAVASPVGETAGASLAEARYGLSDAKPSSFSEAEEKPGEITSNFDKHLEGGPLHVKVARDFVPYNAEPESVKAWLEVVGKDHLEPFITLEAPHNCNHSRACPKVDDPSIGEYSAGVVSLIRGIKELHEENPTMIPAVTLWGAWNEPDFNSRASFDPLYKKAWKAALFWKVARRALQTTECACRMVAGEFAEYSSYMQRYKQTILQNHSFWPGKPSIWGLHDYHDIVYAYRELTIKDKAVVYHNHAAEAFVRTLNGRMGHPHIIMSEQGVELRNGGAPTALLGGDAVVRARRQRDAAHDFLQLRGVAPRRIELVDYYQYRGPSAQEIANEPNTFDSALLHDVGVQEAQEPRIAYCVLALGKESCPPGVATQPPAAGTTTATASSVRLTVDPLGLSTSYFIEYGTTTSYGVATTATTLEGEFGEQGEVVTLAGLEPCTTYHYQAEAESKANEGEPNLGGDKTFKTRGCFEPATAVTAGERFTCALLSEGSVACWGYDSEGELGNGTMSEFGTDMPGLVTGISAATEVAAGEDHACALIAGGSVDCWGSNYSGQLGDGTMSNSATPVAVSGVSDATQVAAGFDHTCTVLASGGVDCWGDDSVGQLGNGTTSESPIATAVAVSGIANATAIAAGGSTTCAVLTSGSVKCWGWNYYGELGNGTKTNSAVPVSVAGITNATAVAVQEGHACAVLSTGSIDCWGRNAAGDLGNETWTDSLTPVAVTGISTATNVSVGYNSTCARLAGGGVDCWGEDCRGELGNGTANCSLASPTPVAAVGISSANQVGSGREHVCVVLSGGAMDCWGKNESGQLADGSYEDASTPQAVLGLP